LIVATLSGRLAGEYLSAPEAVGVACVSGGIASLAFSAGWPRGSEWRPVAYATGTGLAIAGYTLVDGLGVRTAHEPMSYIVWLNILEGPWVFIAAVWYRGATLIPYLRTHWWRGTAGGIVATIAYAIAIWAMSRGALANVAALRETSVLFASAIGAVLLHEGFGWRRFGAAVLVVAGLLLMNFPIFG